MRDLYTKVKTAAKRRPLLFLAAAAQLCVGVYLLAALAAPLTNVKISAQQLQNLQDGVLTVEQGQAGALGLATGQQDAFDTQLDEQGELPLFSSPGFNIGSGNYTLTVEYTAEQPDDPDAYAGTGKDYVLPTVGRVALQAETAVTAADSLDLPLAGSSVSGTVYVSGGSAGCKLVVYAADPTLHITSLQLSEQWGWRVARLVLTLLLFLAADAFALLLVPGSRFALADGHRIALMVLLAAVALVSLPALGDFISHGFDLEFHLSRVAGVAQGLRGGQFPVRIYPGMLNGYGYASPVFYGDLLLYFPAVLYLCGVPLYLAYNAYIVALNLATAAVAYLCMYKMLRSVSAALAGALLYTTAAYRIVNVYYRPALGESSAQIFLPLLVYGFWALYADDADDAQCRAAWLPLALGFSGVLQTHVITTEITVICATAVSLLCIKRVLRRQTLITLGKGAAATVLLDLWFLVPFFTYMMGDYRCTNTENEMLVAEQAIPLPNLLQLWTDGFQSLRIGGALAVAAVGYLLCRVRWQAVPRRASQIGTVGLIGAGVTVYLAGDFPWEQALASLGTIGHYLGAIQFPFRYLVAATVLLCFVAAALVYCIRNKLGRRAAVLCAAGLMAFSCCFAWLDVGQYVDGTHGRDRIADARQLSSGADNNGLEYLPTTFEADNLALPQPLCEDGAVIGSYSRAQNSLTVELEVSNPTGHEATVQLPLTYYPGYRLSENSGGEATVVMVESGRVGIALAPGYAGRLVLCFTPPLRWRAAEIISLISALGLAGFALRRRLQKKQHDA